MEYNIEVVKKAVSKKIKEKYGNEIVLGNIIGVETIRGTSGDWGYHTEPYGKPEVIKCSCIFKRRFLFFFTKESSKQVFYLDTEDYKKELRLQKLKSL